MNRLEDIKTKEQAIRFYSNKHNRLRVYNNINNNLNWICIELVRQLGMLIYQIIAVKKEGFLACETMKTIAAIEVLFEMIKHHFNKADLFKDYRSEYVYWLWIKNSPTGVYAQLTNLV